MMTDYQPVTGSAEIAKYTHADNLTVPQVIPAEAATAEPSGAKPGARKRKSMSPTQRTLALLRKQGYQCEITEHWNAFVRIRKDLFGFCDVLAIAERMLAVQTTSGQNVSHRLAKIAALPAAREWLQAGHRIVIHGWAKRGGRGKRKLWDCREVEVTLDDLMGESC